MSIEKAYDHWSSQYDTNKNRTRDLDRIAARQMLENISSSEVLELGCGTGKNIEFLLSKAKYITAVDFSEKMLQIAKAKHQDKNVQFKKADITKNWDWSTKKYDLITCNLILEHIENLDFIFKKSHKSLNTNGRFFISELHPFKQYKGTKARFDGKDDRIELKTFTHHISEFTNAAVQNGFTIEKLNEFFDRDNIETPRLLSFIFRKK